MSLFMLAAYGFACAAVYHLCPAKIRWVVLLLASYGFYASRSLAGLPFIWVTTGTTWLAALAIARIGESGKARLKAAEKERKKAIRAAARRRQRAVMLAALLLNFGLLAVLKYTDDVRGWFGASPLGLLLPLGISFYTFQSMGYLLDVYNGKYAPQRNLARFALFVSFFPQLIQGPIGRYDQLEKQLENGGEGDVPRAFLLMLWGLAKKMIVADRALPMVSAVFDAPGGTWGGAMAVVGVLAYSVQQYCDFSGGIDLVAGIAELFGIRMAENFRRPYFAVSLGDFWRRWHISLGAWMRDYVFYPFALSKPVSRLSKAAKGRFGAAFARALPAALGNILVFALVGVWHGATSNYILWGLYNGVILAVTALLEPRYKRLNERCARLTATRGFHAFRVLRTFVIVNIGWFFDRCATAGDAVRNINEETHLHLVDFFTVFLVSAFYFKLCFHILTQPEEPEYKRNEPDGSGEEQQDSPPGLVPYGQYDDFQYGRRGIPFAVVVGGFHHEVISAVRQVGVGYRAPVREVIPFFVVTV